MCGDGGRAGVVALFGQGFAQPHDLVFDCGADCLGIAVWTARVWFERRGAFGLVAFDELLDPVTGHVVVVGDLAFAASLERDGGMTSWALDVADLPDKMRCQLCPGTAANYVVKSDRGPTARPTMIDRQRSAASG